VNKYYLLIFSVFVLSVTFQYSVQEIDEDLPMASVEIIIRNSEGQLVTFLTLDSFVIMNPEKFQDFVIRESNSQKDPIVDVDGNKYQKITRLKSMTFNAEEVIASTILADFEGQTLYAYGYFQHDGYPVSTGDKLTTIWTFLRPVL